MSLQVTVGSDGSARADLFFDATERSDLQLHASGVALGGRLFPSATSRAVDIDRNGGGYPFVTIDAQGVYRPGPQPRASLDTRDAVTWLLSEGADSVDVYVNAPQVAHASTWTPVRGSDEESWGWDGITDGSTAPFGVIKMWPDPRLGALPLLLGVISVALLGTSFIMFRHRRRALAMASVAGVLVACAFDVTLAGATMPDNLGVAGILTGTWVGVASTVAVVSLLAAPTALVILVIYAGEQRVSAVDSPRG